MISQPLLRPVRDSDGPALAALIAACFSEYAGCLYEPSEFPELAAPAAWAKGRGTRLVIAEQGEAVIGCAASTLLAETGCLEIHKVYVAASCRGSGLAQQLLDGCFDHAADIGATRLVLWSDTRFTRAHRFYEKLGFLRQPVIRYLADVSATWEYRYERPLKEAR